MIYNALGIQTKISTYTIFLQMLLWILDTMQEFGNVGI